MPVYELEKTDALKAIHGVIRDKTISHFDFTFHANRLIHLLLEKCLEFIPYRDHKVSTPVGEIYSGKAINAELCALSVIRAGESMEQELFSILKNIPVAKILIQRDKITKQPQYFYSAFPDDIARRHVLVMEPMLATGGSALMVIKHLLNYGVPEEHIFIANILASPEGLSRIQHAHPNLTIVTTSIEQGLNSEAFMLPGMGDFGDRYFGTVRKGAEHGQS